MINKFWGFVLSCLITLTLALLALKTGWVKELSTAYVVLFFIALYLLISFKDFYQHLSRQGISWSRLFFFFRMKIWMTFGLAAFFGCLFLLFNIVTKAFVSKELIIQSFLSLIDQPQRLLLWGCMTFIFNAILITLVRKVIKILCTWNHS